MNVSVKRIGRSQIGFIQKRPEIIIKQQAELKDNEESYPRDIQRQPSSTSSSSIQSARSDIISSSNNPPIPQQKEIETNNRLFSNRVATSVPTHIHTEFHSQPIPNNNQSKEIQNTHRIRSWHISFKQKILFFIIFLAIVAICCAAILPPVLIFRQKNNSSLSSITNIIVSMCSRSTCIGQETPFRTSMTTLFYGLDGNLYDSTGLAGGTSHGVPPSTNFITQAMSGQAYSVSSFYFQYITIPYVNLSRQSFTFQLWVVHFFDNGTEVGIFSQCGSTDNICFSLSIRNDHVVLSFDSANSDNVPLIGSATIPLNVWTHITIVYDAIALQQLIYVNGHIDAVSPGIVHPYQGTPAGITTTIIGYSSSFAYPSSYYHGCLDHIIISSGTARSACQILNDASLLVYFPFDKNEQLLDHSNYNSYGYALNIVTISSGRIQQAILFNSSTSYFQSECFPSSRTTMPFSISLWINPTSLTGGGTLVHLSSLQNGTGTPCYDLLALTATKHVVAQLMHTATNVTDFSGPILPSNTWTHLTLVYGSTNGMRLFVNGIMKAMSHGNVNIPVITNNILFVTLANTNPKGPAYSVNCPSGSSSGFISGPFSGAIDDFRLYRRELDAQEICVLANM